MTNRNEIYDIYLSDFDSYKRFKESTESNFIITKMI